MKSLRLIGVVLLALQATMGYARGQTNNAVAASPSASSTSLAPTTGGGGTSQRAFTPAVTDRITPAASAQPVAVATSTWSRSSSHPAAASMTTGSSDAGALAGSAGSITPATSTLATTEVQYDTTDGQRLYRDSVDGTRDDPYNWAVHVFKSQHRMVVYYKGHLFWVFHAVFGRSRWAGGKEWEGDTRTPEGSYLIVSKHRSSRFQWFLKLNYPNGIDEEQFEELKAAHEISARLHMGGQVGIHGTDDPRLNLHDVNWTLGCISVDSADIEEMAALLPVGTLVVIKP